MTSARLAGGPSPTTVVGEVIGYIPSPPANGIHVGSFELHFYGLLIAIAVLVAAWLAQRRWVKLGGFAGTMVPIAFWAVVAGLIGARLYSIATSWQQDTGGNPVEIVEIWNGGLGIWGGVAGGVFGGWLKARRMRVPLPPLLDVVAPALALAQAIGRWGNYFNQELFGLPSKLPWAVRITNQTQLGSILPKYRPPLSASGSYLPGTFQPTFLYESIWDLVTFGLLLLIERRVKLRRGYLFAAYASIYTFGRFFTEYLRIDPSHRYLGLRLNDWTSIGVFVVATAVLLLTGRPKPGDELVGTPLPPDVLERERARERLASHEPEAAEESVDAVDEGSHTQDGADIAATAAMGGGGAGPKSTSGEVEAPEALSGTGPAGGEAGVGAGEAVGAASAAALSTNAVEAGASTGPEEGVAPTSAETGLAPEVEPPAEEAPAADVPAADVPAADVPAADVPAADVPAAGMCRAGGGAGGEVPGGEVPGGEVPTREVPAIRVPGPGMSAGDDGGSEGRPV